MKQREILVVEDDVNIRQGLADTLESEGYLVATAGDGRAALTAYKRKKPDLVLLDIMIPQLSGFDVCRAIRRGDTETPIIMLTAKGEEIDKVVGLEIGADDYITKPFGVRELLARIAAALRRVQPRSATATPPPLPDTFTFGSARIDRKAYTASCHGIQHSLSSREMKIIELFMAHPCEVLTRDALLNHAWGISYYGTTRTLDQHIAQLRKKVEANPDSPATITTVHGIGYRYNPAVAP